MRLYFDTEGDGFLADTTVLHCICTEDLDTGETGKFANLPGYPPVSEGLAYLEQADELVGQNIIAHDLPVLMKLCKWQPRPEVVIVDDLVLARLCFSDIKNDDLKEIEKLADHRRKERGEIKRIRKPAYVFPPEYRNQGKTGLVGKHSAKAWGYRLGILKGSFGETADWSVCTKEMVDYCAQDVTTGVAAHRHFLKQEPPADAIWLEHEVHKLLELQMGWGVQVDRKALYALEAKLQGRRITLEFDLMEAFSGWWKPGGHKIYQRSMTRTNPITGMPERIEKGAEVCQIEWVDFKPTNPHHVKKVLKDRYDWKPVKFNRDEDGNPTGPKLDAEVMAGLPYKEAPLFAELAIVTKRLQLLSTGPSAIMNYLGDDDRVRGRIIGIGTNTFRASHFAPPLGQVPSLKNAMGEVPYGAECRALFISRPGWMLTGVDASGLELRCLGHRLWPWDKGFYADQVVNGDAHWLNAKAIFGLPADLERCIDKALDECGIHGSYRAKAKRFIYMWLYGGGPLAVGEFMYPHLDDESQAREGQILIDRFIAASPTLMALKRLISVRIKEHKAIYKRKLLFGLDRRRIPIRSDHSALNALLQSDGAIVCKRWMVEFHRAMAARGHVHGVDYRQVLWIHDELQIEHKPGLEGVIAEAAYEAMRTTERAYGFKCELDIGDENGKVTTGANWADTH